MNTLKIILPVGLGLLVLTTIATLKIRAEAERRLKVEETVIAARNRQVLSQQEAIKDLEIKRQQARDDRDSNAF